jgi:signal transduction histidine kinase
MAALIVCAVAVDGAEAASLTPLFRVASSEYRTLDEQRALLESELRNLPATPVNQQSEQLGYQLWRSMWDPKVESVWVEVDFGKAQPLDAIVLVPVDAPYREFPGPGYGFPARFRVEIRSEAQTPPQLIADHTREDFPSPGGLPVWLATQGKSARFIRVTMTKPWQTRDGMNIFALGEVMAMRGNFNLAAALPSSAVTASASFESLRVWTKANLIDGQSLLGAPSGAEASPTLGYHSAMADHADVTKWVQVDLGESVALDEVRLIGARVPQFPGRSGFGFPLRFKVEASDNEAFTTAVMIADKTTEDFPSPGSNPVTLPCNGLRGRFIRVTATKLWQRAENFAFCLAELQAYAGGKNIAPGKPVTSLDAYPTKSGQWLPQNLTDGFTSDHPFTEWPAWLQGLSRRREALGGLAVVEAKLTAAHLHLRRLFDRSLAALGVLTVMGIGYGLLRSGRNRRRELEQLRLQIASDLHDDIGSNLGNIALLSEIVAEQSSDATRDDVQEIHRIAQQTADSMRDIVWIIQRPALTAGDFEQRLRNIAARALSGIKWTFNSEDLREVPPLGTQRHLVLAFKEMLHNIRRHAAAKQVCITLSRAAHELSLDIRDDGIGFDPAVVHHGHGLASLRQRAFKLGGELRITSAPGHGTQLVLIAKL